MPSPVEALPWGSRSISSTDSPTAASAVARLIAVVVLPTPPFWLAIAKTCGGVGADSEDDGVTVCYAGEGLAGNVPVLHGLGQFRLPAFPLVEKANSGIGPVSVRPGEQLTERRQGPGRHDVGFRSGGASSMRPMTTRGGFFNPMRRPASPRNAALRASASIRVISRSGRSAARTKPGKSTAAAQVGEAFGLGRDQGRELGRIEDMPGPDALDRRLADEIDRFLPAHQGVDQGVELIRCFT